MFTFVVPVKKESSSGTKKMLLSHSEVDVSAYSVGDAKSSKAFEYNNYDKKM
jgi:hypothetical protein